jgi:hypothetical protein
MYVAVCIFVIADATLMEFQEIKTRFLIYYTNIQYFVWIFTLYTMLTTSGWVP